MSKNVKFNTYAIFDNAVFRSQLIEQLLDGTLVIDPQLCHCIYQVTPDSQLESFEVNVDQHYQAKPCSYETTLHNLGYSIKFLGKGFYGLAAQICQDSECQLTYALKIITFDNKYGDNIDNSNRPENMEVAMLKLLNEKILLPKVSPHIILYIQDFQCKGLPVLWPKGQQSDYDQFAQAIVTSDNYRTDRCLVIISELARSGTLYSYLKGKSTTHAYEFSILYFQFMYTLAQIQQLIPGFRHNDAHAKNILLQTDSNYDSTTEQYYLYQYDHQQYLIPVIPVQLKIWDFDMADVVGKTKNLQAEMRNPTRYLKMNRYFDVYTFTTSFISSMSKELRESSFYLDLLKVIRPNDYIMEGGKKTFIEAIEYTTPHDILLSNPYILKHFVAEPSHINSSIIADTYQI